MKRRTLIIIFVILIILLVLFLLFIYRDKIFKKGPNAVDTIPVPQDLSPSVSVSACAKDASFPLAIGSQGKQVGVVQNYILKKNPNALPKYGADCDWGAETQSAVLSVLGKVVITESDYNSIVTGTTNTPAPDTSVIGKNVYAKNDFVVTHYKSNFAVYRSNYKTGEYVGKVYGIEPGATKYYLLGGNLIVLASSVYAQ